MDHIFLRESTGTYCSSSGGYWSDISIVKSCYTFMDYKVPYCKIASSTPHICRKDFLVTLLSTCVKCNITVLENGCISLTLHTSFRTFSIVNTKIKNTKTLKTQRFGRSFFLPQVLLLKIQTNTRWP
jgi:hypothetical protein